MIRVNVDLRNPGQFFACCGLLELADRMCHGAEGWFEQNTFVLTRPEDPPTLSRAFADAAFQSTMSSTKIARLKKLQNIPTDQRSKSEVAEIGELKAAREAERFHLATPFDIWVDWWNDTRTGGRDFKTWAGRQSVSDPLGAMQRPLRSASWDHDDSICWLTLTSQAHGLPFYFDSDLSAAGAALDNGFSIDKVGMSIQTRPFVELAAFVGLQRFRPVRLSSGEYCYSAWNRPLGPMLASLTVAGQLPCFANRAFSFSMFARNDYYSSFSSAIPIGVAK